MRLKFSAVLILLFTITGTRAQEPIVCMEDSLQIGSSLLPAISVIIPEVKYEKTLDGWIKVLQSGTKSKVVTENGEMTIFGAILKDVTELPANVYSRLLERDSALYLAAAFETRKDLYIEKSTGEADLNRAKSFMFEFARKQYVQLCEEQLKAEEKKLRDLDKELGSLEKDESGMQKTIRKNDRTVSSEKDKLTTLNHELTSLSAAIDQHRRELSTMQAGTEKEEKAAYLKDLEKQKKKTVKAVSRSESRISKAEKAISKAKSDIPKTGRMQDRFRDQINAQEAVVQKYTDKLNKVKGFMLN